MLGERAEWSGAVAAYVDGQQVVDLWGGPEWREDSVVFLYSVTKGTAAICAALLIEGGLLPIDAPVASVWPEFAAAGKSSISVRELLSHQAGLVTVDGGATLTELLDQDVIAAKLAAQRPFWEPGTRHGYHATTLGPLIAELARRTADVSLGDFLRREVIVPLGIERDLYLGFPASEEPRLVMCHQPAMAPGATAMVAQQFAQVAGPQAVPLPTDATLAELSVDRRVRASELASVAGVGNARGLARLYAACIGYVDGLRLLAPETVAIVSETQASGHDAILPFQTRFGIAFQTANPGQLDLAGEGSFGHDGFGGGLGYASPRHGLGFGFVTNRPISPGADPAIPGLTAAILGCAGRA